MDKVQMTESLDNLITEAHKESKCCITGSMLKKAFDYIATSSPSTATDLIECFDGTLHYNNYLTEKEASAIVSKLFSDGLASKWKNSTEFFEMVEKHNGETDDKPAYNKWALWVTMVMLHSDHDTVFEKYSSGDDNKYFEVCYDFAVSQLHDADRLNWIRPYFAL